MGDSQPNGNNTVDSWSVSCSDDEITNPTEWEPSPAEVIELYEMLDQKKIPTLEWVCPGRRSPSVHANETDENEPGSLHETDVNKPEEPNDFDFEDEIPKVATPKITPRRRLTPASSTKRVASFDKVMFDIQRFRKLDELESQKASASPQLSKKTVETNTSATDKTT